MTPQDMIARYAHDVARRLPRDMRADVSAELNALLTEELEAKAGGRAPDLDTARTLLANFGAPALVALNYHTPEPVIDPRDARLFGKLTAAFVTALIILAVSVALSDPAAATDAAFSARIADEATSLGLQILGVLLLVFWAAGAIRRRSPQGAGSPRALPPVRDPDAVNRPLAAFAVTFWSAGLAILAVGPAKLMANVASEAAAPQLLQAFAYDPAFEAQRAPVLWTLLALSIALYAWHAIAGRRTRASRLAEAGLSLVISAALLHIVLSGAVFAAEPANEYMRFAMALTGSWGLIDAVSTLNREHRSRSRQSYAEVTV
ncbi:MAG: hypothetical protein ACK4P2_08980 [Hyphomonas sp.]